MNTGRRRWFAGWWPTVALVAMYFVVLALRGAGVLSDLAASLAQAGLIVVAIVLGIASAVRRSRRSLAEVAHPPSDDR